MRDIEGWRADKEGVLRPCYDSGRCVSGTDKLLQRFLIAFLQESKAARFKCGRNETVGTHFMSMLTNGNMRSEMDVFAAFGLSRPMIRMALQGEESHDDPDDERYKDAKLKTIEITPGETILNIVLSSRESDMHIRVPIEVP